MTPPIRFTVVLHEVSLLRAIWTWLRGGAFARYKVQYKPVLFGQPGYNQAEFAEIYLLHINHRAHPVKNTFSR